MPLLDKEIKAVDAAATKAVDLVQAFAEEDPADATSCWQNPSHMLEQLNEARRGAMEAWKSLQDAKAEQEASQKIVLVEQDLRAQFMDMVTDAFADVLAEMKDKEENIDLDILVDCLQSGMEILSQEDKEFLMDDSTEEDVVAPHEELRRELGFHVETTA